MSLPAQQKWDRASGRYDLFSRGPERRWAPYKRELFSSMRGRVLFLAVGTGIDIQFFPPGLGIVALDLSPRMISKAAPRAKAYDGRIDLTLMDVESLGFPDHSFDQVFTSCTFCSVPDPVAGLRELRRVLRPGGELRMFEHTGSRWFPFNVMMHIMTPLSRLGGPELNRDTVGNVVKAGLQLRSVRNLYLDILRVIVAEAPGL